MNTVFLTEEWKEITKFGIVIPGYFVNIRGDFYSTKTNRILKPSATWSRDLDGNRTKLLNLQHALAVDPDLFEDFDYYNMTPNTSLVRVKVHKAVKTAFEPLDDYIEELGITKEEWAVTPESVKQIIRLNAIIDHKDDDPSNNHVSNLKWSTHIENSVYRKHGKGKQFYDHFHDDTPAEIKMRDGLSVPGATKNQWG